jgi:BirA family biotin operon repressor/biotin-[acetyl-CoA-carboxylase] ligase
MAETLGPPAAVISLVHALADGEWHSGEQLARLEGLSRAALGKRIGRARSDLHLDIEGEAGRGYRLASPLDLIEVQTLSAALGGLGCAVHHYDLTDSTNTRLLETDAAADPQLCIADMQTDGRGRRGRQWHSPYAANLYLSLAYSFAAFPPGLTGLPLALGTALGEVLQEMGVKGIGVKWPNDLVIDGRKLGGLLVESRGEAAGGFRVVIGLGLNVHMRAAEGIDVAWTALAEHLPQRPSRTQLAAAIGRVIVETCRSLEMQGFQPFLPRFAKLDVLAGRPVRVSGNPTLEGTACGINQDGALLVDSGGKRHAVHAGDVSVRPA